MSEMLHDEWDRAYAQGAHDRSSVILAALRAAFPRPTLGIQAALRIIQNIDEES